MSKGKILILLTSHNQLGDTGKATGFHYEELTTPYQIFTEAGYEVLLASVAGGEPPHDPGSLKDSLEDNPSSVVAFLKDNFASNSLKHTRALNEILEIGSDEFDGLYLPGGHGTMWDFPNNPQLAQLIRDLLEQGKPVAAVCHGPAGLVGVKDSDGKAIVDGRRVNCFTDAEEAEAGKDEIVPFLLESALREAGAIFENSGKFEAHVCEDGGLLTGQNPASAERLARAMLDYLRQS
jgi:putative intracellular protease/amidase